MMNMFSLVSLFALAALSNAYVITVINNCAYEIFPALSQHNFANAQPFHTLNPKNTGFPLSPGKQKSIGIPDQWVGGRIWARTGCDTHGNCAVGTCPGGMLCTDYAWTAPTSLAEFGFGGALGTFYDISIIPGFNVGVQIKPSISSCATRTCATANCPADQAYHTSSSQGIDRQCSIDANFDVTFCP